MKKVQLFLFASTLLASLIFLGSFTYDHSKKTTGNSSVNGGGTTLENGLLSTFVFNAVSNSQGTHGHLNYNFRGGDIFIKMDIDCLDINGSRATLSGVVSDVSGTNIPAFIFVGQRASFTVEDNGNGGNNDKISDVILYGGASCADNLLPYLFIQGNISIRE